MENETFLNERVAVVAIFNETVPCQPYKVRRKNGREIIISEIGLSYPVRDGSHYEYIFDVTDGSADYRLVFSTARLTWRLVREADRVIA